MRKVIGIDLGTTNSCVAVMEGTEPVAASQPAGFAVRTTQFEIGLNDSLDDAVKGRFAAVGRA